MGTATYVNFAELKQNVSIETVCAMLKIPLKREGDKLRGKCPVCKSTDDRALVITPSRGLFYCFKGCGGGDIITLVSKVQGVRPTDAAAFIAGNSSRNSAGTVPGTVPGTGTVPGNSSPQPQGLKPLDYLQASHEAIQALGVSEATCGAWGAGYAPKGILRGRLAIPIRDRAGVLLAYCGRTVKDESPTLTFPNGFDPHGVIFGAERVEPGPLYLVRDPLRVLTAFESGIENVVAFLTESITAQQLEILAALMDEKTCESVELF